MNDIEHIESQSYYGVSVIACYFHPNVKMDLAMAQIEALVRTRFCAACRREFFRPAF